MRTEISICASHPRKRRSLDANTRADRSRFPLSADFALASYLLLVIVIGHTKYTR